MRRRDEDEDVHQPVEGVQRRRLHGRRLDHVQPGAVPYVRAYGRPDPGAATVVTCKCGCDFCWGCKGEDHSPATCRQMREWAKKLEDDSMTGKWLICNTKPCPKCGKATEKNGGCNFISCRCGCHQRERPPDYSE